MVRLALGLLALVWLIPASASSVEELQAQGQLQVSAGLRPEGTIVARQKVALIIEVATDRWFAGGTRIEIPEVVGLVILQTEQFASNASEVRNGQTWVIQRWTLDVYAQREGDFQIPPIALQVKVNQAQSGDVSGSLQTPALAFSAQRPEGLAQANHWVASPDYRVDQSFDRELSELVVGDAFAREIRFEASDVMAMMLPGFEPTARDGLAIYPQPPGLENRSNRGAVSATRIERISYVIEAPGQYQLPAREYYWWNTDSGELSLLSLPAVEFEVTAGAGKPTEAAQALRALKPRQIARMLAWALGAVLLLALLVLALKRIPWHSLQRLRGLSQQLLQRWQDLRKPALPPRLNPDSNAED